MGGTKNYSYHNPNKKADSSDGRVTNRIYCLWHRMFIVWYVKNVKWQ